MSEPPAHPAVVAGDPTPAAPEKSAVEAAPTAAKSGRWQRYAHLVGLAILAVVSAYGVHEFMKGDARAVTEVWTRKVPLLPAVLAFAMLDLVLETAGWIWIFHRLGLKVRDLSGILVCISGKAGLLLPAQLGRLIRPDLMVRLGRGTVAANLKGEATVFVLDAISVVALLGGLLVARVHPALGIGAAAVVIAISLLLGNRLAALLSGTKLGYPATFWWSWQAFAIVVVEASGWLAHGLGFYILASDLPGNLGLWDALFLAPGSSVVGLASGLPGGLGMTDALLGASLGFKDVPPEHHALGVAAFRVITFWLLIPVGWIALMWAGRRAKLQPAQQAASGSAAANPIPEKGAGS